MYIHLVAKHREVVSLVSLSIDVNIQGIKKVLEAKDRNGVKNIIFTTSVSINVLKKIQMKTIL